MASLYSLMSIRLFHHPYGESEIKCRKYAKYFWNGEIRTGIGAK